MSERKRGAPTRLGDVIPAILGASGTAERLAQTRAITDWATLVGDQIARVTHPISVSREGVMLVAVKTAAWMSELSLLEPELLRAINGPTGSVLVRKIRWQRWR